MLNKIRLGKTNMMVTYIGFGGIPIQRDTEEEAIAVVKKCLDLGINYFDTANAYSNSEERIGKAIKGQRRENLYLATKTQSRGREGAEKHLQNSLKMLGTDYIDLIQFHNISTDRDFKAIMAPDGAYPFMEEMKKKGIVKHLGVSSHTIDTAKELVKSDLFETMLFPFNFVTREPGEELLPMCRQHDMGFIAMKPLSGGLLDDVTIAFKYLSQFPDVLVIPGIEKPQEIEQIVQIVSGKLGMTAAEQAELVRLQEELGKTFCRRCDYCQPCPEEISISTVMMIKSTAKRMGTARLFSGGGQGVTVEKVATCTQCGLCEGRCPYGLPIMDLIAERLTWYNEERVKFQKSKAS
jgi:predicted aldo/keto reductase-like oxidoreductase